MGKSMPVLWVNSIGTRKPRLGHPSHVGRVVRRLASGFRRAEHKENQLRVLNPILIPKAQSRVARWVNRKLFSWQAGREMRAMGDGPIEYWCFVPNAVDLLGCGKWRVARGGGLGAGVRGQESGVRGQAAEGRNGSAKSQRIIESTNHPIVVYYCVDDWSKFTYLDAAWISQKERELLARADVVFAVSRDLVDKLRTLMESFPRSAFRVPRSALNYAPHGVEYAKFRAALDNPPLPADIAALPRPVIGFYGNIYPWVDLALIRELALRKPEWSFVMIGGVFCDVSRFAGISNVHYLGRREHAELPRYCARFDAAIIPYDMTQPRMESVNPVKTRELLAAGVPVVAADVPELRQFGDRVRIARTVDEWIKALGEQIARTDRAAISESVAGDDWRERVRGIRERVQRMNGHSEWGGDGSSE
jgi:glycosyltransferase involved in cell wall biosynthesis